jgi:integrase
MPATDRLTDRTIRTLRPRDRAYLVPDGRGLYIKVQPGGGRSWLLRYQLRGKVHDLGLGSYPEIGLADARQRALAQRRLKADGVDPLAQRRADRGAKRTEEAKSMTFRLAAERYIAAHENTWRSPKSLAAWRGTLEAYAFPEIGDLLVAAVETGMVVRVLQPIWTAKPETASRVRGRIEAILDYAKALGYRTGENPAAWRGNLAHALPKPSKAKSAPRQLAGRGEHHASLSYPELPAFLADLRQRGGLAARCLEWTILAACRTGEAIGATWQEIDEEARLWCIPGARMKAGRDHRVPLSGAALALLAGLNRDRAKLFPVSNMAMNMLLRRMGRGDLTVHGFRASFATWCKDIGIPAELRELALAHAEGDRVAAAYTSGAEVLDRRRDLAERWARFCAGETGGKVVQLRASAKKSRSRRLGRRAEGRKPHPLAVATTMRAPAEAQHMMSSKFPPQDVAQEPDADKRAEIAAYRAREADADKPSLTRHEKRLLQHGAARIAARRAIDAMAERMSLSEVVRETVRALLGKNWHQASDDEVARITRWAQINVAPIGGGGIDAAALQAALAQEMSTAIDIDAAHPPDAAGPPGPKGGETSVAVAAWEIAEGILADEGKRPPRGHGRLIALARLVNAALRKRGIQYEDDSIGKSIRPSLREWESKNPDK